jgi:hypothetical protein
VGAKDPLFFFFHLAQIVFGIVSFKDPSMMMRMTSTGGGSCEVQVQRGFVEVMDVGHSGAGPSLSSSPKGAYTITRSNSDGSTILLWRQHMERLAQSMLLLAEAMPSKFPDPLPLSPHLKHLIFPSLQVFAELWNWGNLLRRSAFQSLLIGMKNLNPTPRRG